MPVLTAQKLTPFVTQEMQPKTRLVVPDEGEAYTPKFIDGMEYLQNWKRLNPQEWEELLDYQNEQRQAKQAAEARRKMIEKKDAAYETRNRRRMERERERERERMGRPLQAEAESAEQKKL